MLQETLNNRFLDEQIQQAVHISEQELPLNERVLAVFEALGDALLSAEEISHLTRPMRNEALPEVLQALVDEGTLESDDQTNRALDRTRPVLYRLSSVDFNTLHLMAMETRHEDGTRQYLFTCDARILRSIARIDRLDALAEEGVQRDEIRQHVKKIAEGISEGVNVPTPVLLVFLEENVTDLNDLEEGFEDTVPEANIVIKEASETLEEKNPTGFGVIQRMRMVELKVPYRSAAFDSEKPCLLVDGQQRTAALSLISLNQRSEITFAVSALIANASQARQVFAVANNTKKISSDFERALRGLMDSGPAIFTKERTKGAAVRKLALVDAASPFYGITKHPGVTQRAADTPVSYNSLFEAVKVFAESELAIDENDADGLASIVGQAFAIVKSTWPRAWNQPPRVSKLMHGVGMKAMAEVLVSLLYQNSKDYEYDLKRDEVWTATKESLARLSSVVQWTEQDANAAGESARTFYKKQVEKRQNTFKDIEELRKVIWKKSVDLDRRYSRELNAIEP